MEDRSDRTGCLGSNVLETLTKSFQKHGRKPFLGRRTKNTDGVFGTYEWFTYKEIYDRFTALGAGMRSLNLISPHEVIAISSPNRIEWVVADFAAICNAVVTAPIHFETDLATIKYIINHSDSRCVVTDEPSKFLDAMIECPRLESIIKMDDLTLEERERAQQLNRKIYSMTEIEELGKTVQDTFQHVPRRPTDIHTIMYTSGSTGVPKGAVMTDKRWNNFISNPWYLGAPIVHLSFLPLAHTMERQHISIVYPYGGRVGFYSGDVSRIFEDAQELKPSFFSAPPRLYNEIYTQYKKALALAELTVDKTGWENWKATEIEGINYWTNSVTNESSWLSPREIFESQVMIPFESLLGNKVSYLMTGGALTAPSVLAFLRKCFRCVVYDGYGCTETGGISNDNVINPDVDVVLEDVPELGYTKDSKPHPCGQICVKTPFIISGYYKDEKATNANFTSDGYFKTGDIGMKLNDNKIVIIDRMKSIFKLARGEFVAPEMLEGSYLLCKYISQIFIHGEVGRAFLVAIIVPNFGLLHDWLKETNEDVEDDALLCKMDKVKKKIIKELHLTAKELQLKSYEIPKAIMISNEQFTTKNGLLTPSQKNKRQQIIKYYENTIIKQLWQEAESEDQSMSNLVNELLGLESADADTPLSVLGTDSISTVRLFAAIKEKFNKEIPVQLLAGATVNDLIGYIKSDDQPKLPPLFESDCNMTFDRNRLLQLAYASSDVKTASAILLTGATGFLGIFLLKELLEKTEATIYCLVRAKSRDEGLQKLEAKNKQASLNMQFKNRVEVVLGDLDQPNLGIDSATYKKLSEKIDAIFHCGAFVNWVLSYQALRIPNFLGTVEIANFATTNKLKPIHYVSTIGVADLDEEKLIASHFLPHLNNYSLSKYTAEKYLRSSGIPLAIYRPGMITGSSTTGFSNPTDYVNRYISGIIQNKHAFASQNTIDMTPVDHVAKMIVAISLHEESLDKCFHVRSIATISYTAIAQAVVALIPIEVTPYVTWRKTLDQLDKSNPLYDLLPFFPVDQRSLSNSDAWPYKITNAEAILKKDKLEYLLHHKVSEETLKMYASLYCNKQ